MPSRDEEDQVIARLLPVPMMGTYVDVGGAFPIQHSNTHELYLRGWRGLVFEPMAKYWKMWVRDRPEDVLITKAVSDHEGIEMLYGIGEMKTLTKDWPGHKGSMVPCQVTSLRTILADFPKIRDACQFCTIDVEGHEGAVLRGIDFSTFRPKVFVLEAIESITQRPLWQNWEPILLDAGYTFEYETQNKFNRFYVRE